MIMAADTNDSFKRQRPIRFCLKQIIKRNKNKVTDILKRIHHLINMSDSLSISQDKQVRKLKRRLEGLRALVLPLHSILIWNELWHAGAVIGAICITYALLWLLDPSLLSLFAFICLIITLVDYLGPIITANIYTTAGSWTGKEEKKFEDICKSIVISYNWMVVSSSAFYELRITSPRWYYCTTIGMLSWLAYLGLTVDNLLFMFVVTMVIALWPGLQQRGIPTLCFGKILQLMGAIVNPQKSE